MNNKIKFLNRYGALFSSWAGVFSCALVLASNALAAAGSAQPISGAAEAIAAGEKIKAPAILIQKSSKSLADQLRDDMLGQGVPVNGWNDESERWVQVVTAAMPMPASNATADNVVSRIAELNSIIGIKAMRELSKYMGTNASFEVNLSTGGTPVGKKFEEQQKRFRGEIAEAEKMMKEAVDELKQHREAIALSSAADQAVKKEIDQKIKAMTESVEILNKEAQGEPAPMTRINRAMDAVMKQIDPSFDPAIASANAQSKAAELQGKLDALKADRTGAVSEAGRLARAKIMETEKRIAELSDNVAKTKADAEVFFNEYSQTRLSRTTGWLSEHVLVGLIPIKYYYGIVPTENKNVLNVTVAAAYVWSPACEREVRALITEDGLGTVVPEGKSGFATYGRVLKKGELSLSDWVRKQDPLTFGPARFYVDNKGEFFVLSSAIDMFGKGAASQDASEIRVAANAQLSMLMSLDVQFRDQASVSSDTQNDDDDAAMVRKAKAMASAKGSKMLMTSVEAEGESLTIKLSDGSDSKPLRYQIRKQSAKSVRDSYKAVLQQADSSAQAVLASARSEGARKAALDHVKAAEAKAGASRAEGYGKAQADLAPKVPPATTKSSPANTGSVYVPIGPAKEQSTAPVKTGIKKDNTPVPDF